MEPRSFDLLGCEIPAHPSFGIRSFSLRYVKFASSSVQVTPDRVRKAPEQLGPILSQELDILLNLLRI